MANWEGTSSREIIQRIVVEGVLVLDTPAHFGSGESDGTDMLLLRDATSQQPLLPGASIAGALRHYLLILEAGYRSGRKAEQDAALLFGKENDETTGEQSRVIVDDVLGEGTVTSRDGVKIKGETRTAEDQALYSIQVWERGAKFPFHIELAIHDRDDVAQMRQAFASALSGLDKDGGITLGARKHRGYGRCHVEEWRVATYDLQTVSGLMAWLSLGDTPLSGQTYTSIFDALGVKGRKDNRAYVKIEAQFKLLDTLLIRAGSDVADTAHLTGKDGIPLLSGTSVTGALRARATRIINSLNPAYTEAFMNDLFGAHGDVNKAQRQASRLLVQEQAIEGDKLRMLRNIQNRVKIDRFTGGAFETALFDQQPVFSMNDTLIKINLELRYPAQSETDENSRQLIRAQTGLLLLLLKDLWTGELPLGGESSIGRGRLEGIAADIEIKYANEAKVHCHELTLPFNLEVMDLLEAYVQDFVAYLGVR